MILPIVKYGHPMLRQKGARIESMTPEIARLIADMLDTMYKASGIGLAAQQVGQALQLTVLDVRAAKDRPSTLEIGGKAAEVASFMPLVLINPVIRAFGEPASGPEGCLSFPEVYADVTRPESVEVQALSAKWETVDFKASGLRDSSYVLNNPIDDVKLEFFKNAKLWGWATGDFKESVEEWYGMPLD